MKRQTIAALTAGSFMIFSFSCFSVQGIKPKTLASQDGRDLGVPEFGILRLEKKSGESIVFSRSRPGRVAGNSVRGIGAVESFPVTMEISRTQVKRIIRREDRVVSVTTLDDVTYPVQKIIQKQETFEIWTQKYVEPLVFEPVSIPLEQVKEAYAERLDLRKTLDLVFVCVGALFLLNSLRIIYNISRI